LDWASVRQPSAGLVQLQMQLDAPQKTPNSNGGPSIRVGKKDIAGEKGLSKTAFPVNLGPHVNGPIQWARSSLGLSPPPLHATACGLCMMCVCTV